MIDACGSRRYKETAEGHLTAQGVALEDVRQKQKKLVGKVTQAGAQSKASFKPLRETLAKLRADVLEQNESFRNQIGVLNGMFLRLPTYARAHVGATSMIILFLCFYFYTCAHMSRAIP